MARGFRSRLRAWYYSQVTEDGKKNKNTDVFTSKRKKSRYCNRGTVLCPKLLQKESCGEEPPYCSFHSVVRPPIKKKKKKHTQLRKKKIYVAKEVIVAGLDSQNESPKLKHSTMKEPPPEGWSSVTGMLSGLTIFFFFFAWVLAVWGSCELLYWLLLTVGAVRCSHSFQYIFQTLVSHFYLDRSHLWGHLQDGCHFPVGIPPVKCFNRQIISHVFAHNTLLV